MKLFDAHCHLQMPQYNTDRAEVLARMHELDICAVVVGTDLESSKAGLALSKQHDFLWASVGSHPNHVEEFDITKFEELARDPKVVAIGECGLDYFRSEKGNQAEKFEAQINLAQKLNKALIVHCRDSQQRIANTASAHDDCFVILQKARMNGFDVPIVMHFFTGTAELAKKYIDLGCYLSFPGPITYTGMYDESIRICPIDKMLVETDSPFAAPVPYRGARNEPMYVEHVVVKLAAVKGLGVNEIGHKIVENSKIVFGLR